MKAQDILFALRETAMGRANTPMQQQLAEKLEKLFAGKSPEERAAEIEADLEQNREFEKAAAAKRTRKAKAE